MNRIVCTVVALTFAGIVTPAIADRDGHGRSGHRGGEYKEVYWEGNCKVERKWERNGRYKEERECRGRSHPPSVVHQPAVVVQPPSVVIQPPAIVIPPPPVRIR